MQSTVAVRELWDSPIDERWGATVSRTSAAPRTPDASRRAFLGLGTAAAAGALGAIATTAIATPAAAAPAVAAPLAAASLAGATGVLPAAALPIARAVAGPRAIASLPFAQGGPETRDASLASTTPAGAAVRVGKQYSTFAKAAKAAGTSTSTVFATTNAQAHLLRRATFGARPKDVAELKKLGIDKWIARQLKPSTITDTEGAAAWKMFPLAGATPSTIRKSIDEYSWDAVFETAQASLATQVFSQRQLYEITVDIFANHLHVPLPGEQWHTAPGYIQNVIRKYAFGSYKSMLHAAMRHPAMLNFLNNDESRKANVNENLGRELLELHTVGIAGKYTEKDVRASAAILSGRTWNWKTGSYVYDPDQHVTGRVTVLGFSRANLTGEDGEAVGDAYLTYLARHPATATAIARKIAVRFVSDTPSDDLVKRLAKVYLKYDTNIRKTVEAVFLSSDFWMSVGTRMRRPLEDAVGTLRVLDVRRTSKSKQPLSWLYWALNEAGHTPHGWAPPNGYPDVSAAWLGAGAMIQRWNLHRAFANGWWTGFTYVKPSKLVTRTKNMTARQWTAAVSLRLFGMKPKYGHLDAAVRGAQLSPTGAAPTDDWRCGMIVALLLDSPYFQLR